jgi:hypothetical protein
LSLLSNTTKLISYMERNKMHIKLMRKIIFIIFILLIVISCGDKKPKGSYTEGKLEYKITYLNAKQDNYDPSFLPKKMILEFNQDLCIFRIDGFMGMFRLGNVTYFKKHKVRTHLKVLDKNYSFNGSRNEMMCCFDCMDGMIVNEDTTTVITAGLKSKKATINFKDGQEPFDILYTYDIQLNKPNSTNPYRKIDGVLTNFRLKMGPYLMQFSASKFTPDIDADTDMEIPSEATEVDREELVAILGRLMEQNK